MRTKNHIEAKGEVICVAGTYLTTVAHLGQRNFVEAIGHGCVK